MNMALVGTVPVIERSVLRGPASDSRDQRGAWAGSSGQRRSCSQASYVVGAIQALAPGVAVRAASSSCAPK